MRVTWKNTHKAAEFASFVAVVVAIGVALFEYYSNAHQTRVQRSIDLLSMFNAPELRETRLAIEKPWLEYDLAALNALKSNVRALEHLSEIIVADNPELIHSLTYIVNLVDMMGLCVQEEICDKAVIERQIGGYVRNIYCLYGTQLERLREAKLLPDLGRGMAHISEGTDCVG